MTREEIDRHVAGIQALRKRRSQRSGLKLGNEFNARRRRVIEGVNHGNIDAGVSPVDVIFAARGRYGWLPRGGDE